MICTSELYNFMQFVHLFSIFTNRPYGQQKHHKVAPPTATGLELRGLTLIARKPRKPVSSQRM